MAAHNQTLDCVDPLSACVRLCARVQQMQLHVVNYSRDCWQNRNKFITRGGEEKERNGVIGMQETERNLLYGLKGTVFAMSC